MFTGIVKEIGKVAKIFKTGSSFELGIISESVAADANISDSISVNGVCLTLTKKNKNELVFDVITSSLENTNIKNLKKGDHVNLEPSLSVGDKLGGHFVLGHVDKELKIIRFILRKDYWELEIELPSAFRKFVVLNGSITIEGISLTIKKVLLKSFIVNIIPFSYTHTNLKYKKSGIRVNIEFDYLLKQNINNKK